jgi:RNA polymerase sigma-54 factor
MAHLGARLKTDASLRIDPRVVLGSHLLRLTQIDLAQAIQAELAENPALEQIQEDFEPLENDQILKTLAPSQLKLQSEDYEFTRSSSEDEHYTDWVDYTAGEPSLHDHLIVQMLPSLPARLSKLAYYLVDSVNSKGYLEEPDEEIAMETGNDLDDVALAVAALQSCEPAGVGARNLMECLLLQLRNVDSLEQRLARSILKTRMDDFLARRVMKLSRRFDVMPDVIEGAFNEIMKLQPYPGESFQSHSTRKQAKSVAAPDLIITRTDQGWSVEVRGPDIESLQISRPYLRRAHELRTADAYQRDEKRHIQHYVQRASDFLSCLEQRKQTLQKIGEFLLEHQANFMNTGSYQFLQPLTRSRMAAEIGLHESTVSRATSDKFVQIPSGALVNFEVFFKPALRVQKMIEEILATENPDNPLSDDRISEILSERGIQVARRTVNKYRDRTKFLSSRKRHSA